MITRTYYKGANGIALVYDVTDPDSFRNVNYWMANIQTHADERVSRQISPKSTANACHISKRICILGLSSSI